MKHINLLTDKGDNNVPINEKPTEKHFPAVGI